MHKTDLSINMKLILEFNFKISRINEIKFQYKIIKIFKKYSSPQNFGKEKREKIYAK